MPDLYHHEYVGYISCYQKTKVPHISGIGREVSGNIKSGHIFPLWLAVSEVTLHDRVIYTGFIHDLSVVKKTEEEIKAVNKELESKVEEHIYEL